MKQLLVPVYIALQVLFLNTTAGCQKKLLQLNRDACLNKSIHKMH